MSKPILVAKNLHKTYKMGPAEVRVLRGASVSVDRGEFVAINGASGSGKSTFLHILGALDVPDRGRVAFRGEDLFGLSRRDRMRYCNLEVGFVFQFYHLLPELTALENVLIARLITHSGWAWRGVRKQACFDAEEILEHVGLSGRAKHRPNELSGGERQRVAIARALVNRPALLLADEPTGNLDASIGGDILKLLTGLNEGGQTIVMVTHDPKVASRAHRRTHLIEGVLREGDGVAERKRVDASTIKEVTS